MVLRVISSLPLRSLKCRCFSFYLRPCISNIGKLRSSGSLIVSKMPYTTIERGSPNTLNYKLYIRNENGPISAFHDIPMFADEDNRIYHMVVEVPRWTNAKMEISKSDALNPIKQDIKNGKLRFVQNCFPHHGYIWNYGAIPQTWENPNHLDESTGCKGDNDPIDVCEIGYRVAQRGEVIKVKALGIMALIDEGETDWKVLAIDVNDPLAEQLHDVEDIEKHFPGLLKATHEWFRIYKIPDGKPENVFAFNGEAKNREFAENIIAQTNQHWKDLISKNCSNEGIDCSTVSVEDSPYKISVEAADEIVNKEPEVGSPQPIDPIVNKWNFLRLKL